MIEKFPNINKPKKPKEEKDLPEDSIENNEKERLPQVDGESGIYTDEKKDEWTTVWIIAQKLGIGIYSLERLIESLPFSPMNGLGMNGQEVKLYNLTKLEKDKGIKRFLELPQVDRKSGIYTDEKKDEWATAGITAQKLGIGVSTLKRLIESLPFSLMNGLSMNGQEVKLYNLTKLEKDKGVKRFLELPQVDRKSGIYTDEKKDEWVALHTFVEKSGKGAYLVKKMITDQNISEIPGLNRKGEEWTLYSLSDFMSNKEIIRILSLPHVDRKSGVFINEKGQWTTINVIVENVEKDVKWVKKMITDQNISEIPGLNRKGEEGTLYNLSEFMNNKEISRVLELPQVDETGFLTHEKARWASIRVIAQELGIGEETTARLIKDQNTSEIQGLDRGGQERTLYSLTEFMENEEVKAAIERLLYRGEEKEQTQEKEQSEDELKELLEGDSKKFIQFLELVTTLGLSVNASTLLVYHPQFQKIGHQKINGMIAEYLGDFIPQRGSLNLKCVLENVSYIRESTLREGLIEAFKREGIEEYFKSERDSETRIFFEHYIEELRTKLVSKDEEHRELLTGIIDEIESFYQTLFIEFERGGVVDSLKEGRDFPDIAQRINIAELREKKRILIADEMGLGKSASAILSKEFLGAQQALVVVPSNVIETWRGFLSDNVSEDGKQIGYFNKDQAPNILIIESLEDLEGIEEGNYDYVIISQERLNNAYTEGLKNLDYDMLIVDEIHKLKNLKGVRSSHLVELSEKLGEDGYLALLSGTPAPNKVKDIAISLKLLYPEKYKDTSDNDLVSEIINGSVSDIQVDLVLRMQTKKVDTYLEMPKLSENNIEVVLSDTEKEIYEIILEEDEMTAPEKIQAFRQFLLNPALLDVMPYIKGSKNISFENRLNDVFKEKDKIVVFVNGYIEDVIRGEQSIIDSLNLPEGVIVESIHGDVDTAERGAIKDRLDNHSGKMLLLVSGQTADVGVDFSSADHVMLYNEPWTMAEEEQQKRRVYRPGIGHNLEVDIFVTRGTIEEGMHEYIRQKEKVIQKLLKAIPLTESEKELVIRDEAEADGSYEVNAELAKFYFKRQQILLELYGKTKGSGRDFLFYEFLPEHGEEYAEYYRDIRSRGYQANTSRVSGTLLSRMIEEDTFNQDEIKILDIASGPEMLKRHIDDSLSEKVISIDANRLHFLEGKTSKESKREGVSGRVVVGDFLQLPFEENSFEYVNLGLALRYTSFIPSKGNYETAEVFGEINRVLKIGGKAVIAMTYANEFKDFDKFKEVVSTLGLEVVDNYTGEASNTDGTFSTNIITLKKIRDIEIVTEEDVINERTVDIKRPAVKEILSKMDRKKDLIGMKLYETKRKLRQASRNVVENFKMNGTTYDIIFNNADQKVLEEEKKIYQVGEDLKLRYGNIVEIPEKDLIDSGFSRIHLGKRYVLFKQLSNSQGAVRIR